MGKGPVRPRRYVRIMETGCPQGQRGSGSTSSTARASAAAACAMSISVSTGRVVASSAAMQAASAASSTWASALDAVVSAGPPSSPGARGPNWRATEMLCSTADNATRLSIGKRVPHSSEQYILGRPRPVPRAGKGFPQPGRLQYNGGDPPSVGGDADLRRLTSAMNVPRKNIRKNGVGYSRARCPTSY
jgi:hypothetical protein